jgi:nondiscriminating glutamyl-tRNA synthetase
MWLKMGISSFSALMFNMMNPQRIRVRYAPSPTGFLHIGGARTALFNYLFAKKQGGDFIIRVEDTDIERNVEGGEVSQLHDLAWLGIVPDESPLKPNPRYAPYRQMERLDTYQTYAQQLVKEGKAYRCYCSEAELEQSREEQMARGIVAPQYDRRCLHLTDAQRRAFEEEGRKPVIRLKLEDHKTFTFHDLVRGDVSFNNDDIGDWVLIKSNGIPTYNYAVVIDDHLMDISHVFRGEEHLSNTPKQLQIYDYLGWTPPQFGHMTLIVNEQGKKLSKRDLSIVQFMSQYRQLGYLPEAIFNFILLLGWAPEGTQEMFTKEEAIAAFDPQRLSKSPSFFDVQKLNWLNHQYIKALPEHTYVSFIEPFVQKALVIAPTDLSHDQVLAVARLFQEQITFGENVIDLMKPILAPSRDWDEEAKAILALPETPRAVEAFLEELSRLETLTPESVKALFKAVQTTTGIKGKPLFMPIRLALTGQLHGVEMAALIPVLGKTLTIARINAL